MRLYSLVALLAALAPASAQSTLHPWEVFEVVLEAGKETTVLPDRAAARIEFRRRGASDHITVDAFWDGGAIWRARFAPPSAGEWDYRSQSSDKQMNNRRGRIEVEPWREEDLRSNPARRGFLTVARDGHHFAYPDGTPFLWIGDTWWAWSKKGIRFETFQKLVDDRAKKGFTIGQMYFPGRGTMLDGKGEKLDVTHIHDVERMIAYANSRGITVWIHPWWSGKALAQIGPDQVKRWWSYVIARLGAYNVIWTLAGEYNMDNYGGLGLPFWKELGAMVRKQDPYRRLISAHPTPPGWRGGADAPQWSTGDVLHSEPWLDYNQSQVGHSRSRNEMIPLVMAADYMRKPAKPTVVTEPWYEFIDGHPTAEEVRFAAWSAILSGAAGHTYGGGQVWWAHVPEAPNKQGNWPLHREFDTDTLDYPGAISMSVLAKFLQGLEWWKLVPHPELVKDYAQPFCAAVPGQEYVVYLRWGGALRVDLRPSAETDNFEFTFIDLTDGRPRKPGRIVGGTVRDFHAPDDYPGKLQYRDFTLHIKRLP